LPAGAPIARSCAIERIDIAAVAKWGAERLLRANQPRALEHQPDPQDRKIDLGVELEGRAQGILRAREDGGELGGLGGGLGGLDLFRRSPRRWSSRVGDRRGGVQDAPWLGPPFPASCPFRGFHHSVSGPRHIEPDRRISTGHRGRKLLATHLQ
jgi:hypothetical protein